MDCLRSFNFAIANQSNYGSAQGFLYWQIGTQHFWTLDITSASGSKYLIEGFKNINIFKIQVTGDFNSSPQFAPFQCIVQNWNLGVQIVGQNSSAVGNVVSSPNPFSMILQGTNPTVYLSKFNPSIEFETPIQSAKEIIIKDLFADGIANNTTTSAQIGYLINFTVFYKYEGE
jgi:hypothetical protein